MGGFVSRADAVYAAKVALPSLKNWIHRGWIDSEGNHRKVRCKGLLVDYDDILDAERDTRLKTQRSHRRQAA